MIAENRKPGTTAWKIHGQARGITGFAGQVYARSGQQVTLYVSTAGPWFRARAFRMGYYEGKGGRLIWRSSTIRGQHQAKATRDDVTNMVEAPWDPSVSFDITRVP